MCAQCKRYCPICKQQRSTSSTISEIYNIQHELTQPSHQLIARRCACCRGPGGRELWLCMAGGAGEALEQWDLHVGAELDVLGRKVVLRKVRRQAA